MKFTNKKCVQRRRQRWVWSKSSPSSPSSTPFRPPTTSFQLPSSPNLSARGSGSSMTACNYASQLLVRLISIVVGGYQHIIAYLRKSLYLVLRTRLSQWSRSHCCCTGAGARAVILRCRWISPASTITSSTDNHNTQTLIV